jgi:hypothetical protein
MALKTAFGVDCFLLDFPDPLDVIFCTSFFMLSHFYMAELFFA